MISVEDIGEDLCKFCPLEEYNQGSRLTPGGYISCEGSHCEEALDCFLSESDDFRAINYMLDQLTGEVK